MRIEALVPQAPLGYDANGNPINVSREWYRFLTLIRHAVGSDTDGIDNEIFAIQPGADSGPLAQLFLNMAAGLLAADSHAAQAAGMAEGLQARITALEGLVTASSQPLTLDDILAQAQVLLGAPQVPVPGLFGIQFSVLASEDLSAGDIVTIYSDMGVCKMQKANATDGTKKAFGFVLAAIATGSRGVFYGSGQMNTRCAGLTPGAVYYLDTTDGAVTTTAPVTPGNLVQNVGYALSATVLAFAPDPNGAIV